MPAEPVAAATSHTVVRIEMVEALSAKNVIIMIVFLLSSDSGLAGIGSFFAPGSVLVPASGFSCGGACFDNGTVSVFRREFFN